MAVFIADWTASIRGTKDVTEMVNQQRKVAAARMAIMEAISRSDERDVSVWIAALVESLKRVSDWNLELERGQPAPLD